MNIFKIAPVAAPLLLAVALSACTKPDAAKPAVDTAKISDAVKADANALAAALNARDADKAVSHDAPQIVAMFHGAPNMNSAAEDLALTKQQVADPAFKLTVSNETVDVAQAGDMAVYRASYVATLTGPDKKLVTENGNWILQYKPQSDGSWKVALSVVSDTPPPASAPTAEPAKK
jgi:ketosteroid isomerase-like protein